MSELGHRTNLCCVIGRLENIPGTGPAPDTFVLRIKSGVKAVAYYPRVGKQLVVDQVIRVVPVPIVAWEARVWCKS